MKIHTTLIALVCLISFGTTAQKIRVLDNSSLQPIADVIILSESLNKTVITNAKGTADLSAFKNAENISFTHVSYISVSYSYAQLAALNFKITMLESTFSFEDVVVSASKFEEKARDVAQPVQVIRSKELRFMNQSTTADVMQQSGNVLVQKSQLGGGSPIIRGFETNKVLMVVDGVRMNNAIYRGGHLQNIITLDNTIMDRVEIVFGPGSVVYGSDALGGVMHFHTIDPLLSDSANSLVRANAFVRSASAAMERTAHVDFSIGGQKFGSLTSITFSQFDDLRQGNWRNPFYGDWGKRPWYVERINGLDSALVNPNQNIQKQSGYDQIDLLQKFLFKQNNNVSHILNFQYSTSSDVPRYDRLTLQQGANPRFAEWYYGPQERLFASYTLKLKGSSKMYDQAVIIGGIQLIEESRHDRRFRTANLNRRTENLRIATLNADFAKHLGKHEIRYGIDAWMNTVASTAERVNIESGEITPLDTRYPDGGSTMQSIAGYVTHSYEISEKLILNDGIRVNNVSLDAVFSDKTFFPFPFDNVSQNNTAINGNIGLVFMPEKGWRFTAIGSSGFRAPNVDDLSKVFESVPGRVVVPNPDLKPEMTLNGDLGVSKSFDDKLTVGVTGFYTKYTNAIAVRPTQFNGQDSIVYNGELSRVTTSQNAAEAYIYGFNGYFNADVTERFGLSGTVNYTYGRIRTDTTDYPLDHIPPVFGRVSFNLKLKQVRTEFFVMYNGSKNARDYNLLGEDNQAYSADPVNGFMPAWMTLNLRTSVQLNQMLQVQLALENILDQNYRVYASNISAPGRNFVATIRGTF